MQVKNNLLTNEILKKFQLNNITLENENYVVILNEKFI